MTNNNFIAVSNICQPITLKQHRVRKDHQSDWLTPEIIDTIKERNKCKINGNQSKYVLLRNKVSSMIRSAKNNMYKTTTEKGKEDPRTIWKIFKEFGASRKTGTKDTILGLKENDRLISDENEIANVFNKYFVNVASQLKEPVEHSDFKHITEYVDSKMPNNTFLAFLK